VPRAPVPRQRGSRQELDPRMRAATFWSRATGDGECRTKKARGIGGHGPACAAAVTPGGARHGGGQGGRHTLTDLNASTSELEQWRRSRRPNGLGILLARPSSTQAWGHQVYPPRSPTAYLERATSSVGHEPTRSETQPSWSPAQQQFPVRARPLEARRPYQQDGRASPA